MLDSWAGSDLPCSVIVKTRGRLALVQLAVQQLKTQRWQKSSNRSRATLGTSPPLRGHDTKVSGGYQ